MDKESIKQVSWIGEDWVCGAVRGVVLSFHGLGGGHKFEPSTVELEWARAGALVVYPYCGPWSWMNRQVRQFVDQLVDDVYELYGLASDLPLISTGGSMGGLGSLLYTRYAKRPIAACLAFCPVCDLRYHFNERPDLPATIRCAFMGYKEDLPTLLAEHSPICQVAAMPDIPYLFIHGDKDNAVAKAHHSDPMVAAMRARKMNVRYLEVPGMGHGNCMPMSANQEQVDFIPPLLKK
jgi:dipeptidyl aminopeptidase/acylaminoacyl peptidase